MQPINLPVLRGAITAADVFKAKAGMDGDNMIKEWCISVGESYTERRDAVIKLLSGYLKKIIK